MGEKKKYLRMNKGKLKRIFQFLAMKMKWELKRQNLLEEGYQARTPQEEKTVVLKTTEKTSSRK